MKFEFFFYLEIFQHYKLLSDRLQELGSHFGALPVHGGKYNFFFFHVIEVSSSTIHTKYDP